MDDFNLDKDESEEKIKFTCPECGPVLRDNVIFLCNRCDQTEMILKEGIYMCPSCLKKGENFECIKCGSKEVVMATKD
jgi:predicted RNA-binding Zn-ribbon protein involved in translation (DUF1610 family)